MSGAANQDSPAPRRRPLLVSVTMLWCLGFALWAAGQVLRDVTWYTGLCFYIPSPLLAIFLTIQAIWLLRRQRVRLGGALLVLASFPILATALVENQWSAPVPPPQSTSLPKLRLVHWNVWYARRGWAPILQRLVELHADIYVLSEAPRSLDVETTLAALGPDFSIHRFEDMAVLARGEFKVHERLALGRHGWGRLIDWESPAGPLRLLAADFPSHPRTHRAPLLQALQGQIQSLRPDIVVGDFNAPRRSPGLLNLPYGYRHAYLVAGSGWSYTFPVYCPAWAIDQCITGPTLLPLHYELQSTVYSDHRLQVCDLAVQPNTAEQDHK